MPPKHGADAVPLPSKKRVKMQAPPTINIVETKQEAKTKKPGASPSHAFNIVAGCYERILYGLQAALNTTADGQITVDLQPVFSFPAHQSCIKNVATGRTTAKKLWLATSSTDDTLKLWDLSRRKEVGSINAHDSLVTRTVFVAASSATSPSAELPTSKYMLTASNDSTLNLFRTKDWSLIRSFKGHQGRINDVAVHPQGRIALSVGQDRTLRMWDLLGSQGQAAGGGKQGSSSTKLGAGAATAML